LGEYLIYRYLFHYPVFIPEFNFYYVSQFVASYYLIQFFSPAGATPIYYPTIGIEAHFPETITTALPGNVAGWDLKIIENSVTTTTGQLIDFDSILFPEQRSLMQ